MDLRFFSSTKTSKLFAKGFLLAANLLALNIFACFAHWLRKASSGANHSAVFATQFESWFLDLGLLICIALSLVFVTFAAMIINHRSIFWQLLHLGLGCASLFHLCWLVMVIAD